MKTSNIIIFFIFVVLIAMMIIIYATNKRATEPFETIETSKLENKLQYPELKKKNLLETDESGNLNTTDNENLNKSVMNNKQRLDDLTEVVKALKTNQDILKIPNLTEAEKNYMEALIETKNGITDEQLNLLAKQVLALDVRINKNPGNLI